MTNVLFINYFCRREMIYITICFILLLSFRNISKQTTLNNIESLLGIKVNDNTIPCYMYVSLHPNNAGGWNLDRYDEYFVLVSKNNYNYAAANKIALTELEDMITDSPDYLITLIPLKLYTAYHDNIHMFDCAYIAMTEEDQITYRNFFDILHTIDYFYYVIIIFLVFISFILNLKIKSPKIFCLNLIIIGGLMLVVFIESQSRYKYSIQPFWCILAGFSLEFVYTTLEQTKGRIKTSENNIFF